MASLDPRFICTSDLDTYYVDNASGLPMSGGIVTFYSDVNRTTLKPVYQLTGTPGNYTYAPLNNPCTLSSSGTFQDGLGNNIVPYYYPFTGTPETDTGIAELYYVVVVNSGFVPQFVRQGWPQAAAENEVPVTDFEIDNFIPNGQFLSHNKIVSLTEPPITQFTFAGSQTIDAQAIAQGGWYFAYTDGTDATFANGFTPIPSSGGWGINSFPKFLFDFVCTNFGSVHKPLTRDLWITWPDVNKFSSGNPPGTIPYTLFFDARSNDGNSYTFNLFAIYYFGTGGSPSPSIFSTQPLATITIGPSATLTNVNIQDILFEINQGTIGTNGDDFVGLALRGPMSGWNISVSDFVLAQGNEKFTSFPVQTNDQMLSRGVAGFMPTPDPAGLDLFLPLILTPQGMTFDQSTVGQIIAKFQQAALPNELLMDGTTYIASKYSTAGIPYQRLMNYLVANSPAISSIGTVQLGANVIPLTGTGSNFVTLFNVTAALTTEFIVQINTTASGGSATGTGAISIAATSANNFYTATVNSVPTAGYFWSFINGGTNLVYNVWYSINGVGTAPAAPTGANIQVNLTGTPTVVSTIAATLAAVNQYQFVVPNLQGLFLRGLDPTSIYDLDYATRFNDGIMFNNTDIQAQFGPNVSTLELAAYLSHTHPPLPNNTAFFGTSSTAVNAITPTGGAHGDVATTGASGGTETRPVNIACNFFIKY